MSAPVEKMFHIIRQDSNGNHFLEERNLSEQAADAFLQKRQKEIGDHHQTIWKQSTELPLPEPLHQ